MRAAGAFGEPVGTSRVQVFDPSSASAHVAPDVSPPMIMRWPTGSYAAQWYAIEGAYARLGSNRSQVPSIAGSYAATSPVAGDANAADPDGEPGARKASVRAKAKTPATASGLRLGRHCM